MTTTTLTPSRLAATPRGRTLLRALARAAITRYPIQIVDGDAAPTCTGENAITVGRDYRPSVAALAAHVIEYRSWVDDERLAVARVLLAVEKHIAALRVEAEICEFVLAQQPEAAQAMAVQGGAL